LFSVSCLARGHSSPGLSVRLGYLGSLSGGFSLRWNSLFNFCPSFAESRGIALCPASILVLKDLIFSWQDFLVQIAVSLHLGLRHHLTLCCLSLRAGLGACLSVGHLPPVLLAFLVRA
jgi:hypothetical protein